MKIQIELEYDMLVALLKDANWRWEHIDSNEIRIYGRFYGGDFKLKEIGEPLKEQMKVLTERGIKHQIREIIKDNELDNKEGISVEEIFGTLLMVASNEGVSLAEVKEHIRDMFNDGEIYESRPNKIRWLE